MDFKFEAEVRPAGAAQRVPARGEPVMGLGAGRVAGCGDSARQAVHGWACDPLGAQPVAGQVQTARLARRAQAPGQKKHIQQLALPGAAQPSAQPGEH